MNINEFKASQVQELINKLNDLSNYIDSVSESITDDGLQAWFGGLPSEITNMQAQFKFQVDNLSKLLAA